MIPLVYAQAGTMLRRLVHWLQPLALILSVMAIGWFLSRQWPVLRNYPWRLDWGWLAITFLFTWASWAVEIALWRHLLLTLGSKLPYVVAARIWFLSAIVRYVPGNIWQPISMTLYARRHGVPPEATITSLILFQVVMLLAIAPIFIAYFCGSTQNPSPPSLSRNCRQSWYGPRYSLCWPSLSARNGWWA
jgi:hypothetical protein